MKTIGLLLALAFAAPATAQMQGMAMPAAALACTAPAIVPGFEGWGKAPLAQLGIGHFSELVLAPAEAVKFVPALNRAPAPGSKGGVYYLSLAKPGTYRFALGAAAWIDVIGSKSERVESVAHVHGPACSGITKIVDYKLDPGEYAVQFSATSDPRLAVMLIGG